MGSDETTPGRSIDPKLSLILGSSCYQLPFWRHPRSGCILSIFGDHKISFLPFLTKQVTDHHKSIQHNLRSKRLSLGSWKPQCCSFLSFLHLQWAERSRVKSMSPVGSTQCFMWFWHYPSWWIPSLLVTQGRQITIRTTSGDAQLELCARSLLIAVGSLGLSIGYPQWSNGNINFPNLPCLANEKRSTLFWGQVPVEKTGGLAEGKSPNIIEYPWIWNLDLEWTTIQA